MRTFCAGENDRRVVAGKGKNGKGNGEWWFVNCVFKYVTGCG